MAEFDQAANRSLGSITNAFSTIMQNNLAQRQDERNKTEHGLRMKTGELNYDELKREVARNKDRFAWQGDKFYKDMDVSDAQIESLKSRSALNKQAFDHAVDMNPLEVTGKKLENEGKIIDNQLGLKNIEIKTYEALAGQVEAGNTLAKRLSNGLTDEYANPLPLEQWGPEQFEHVVNTANMSPVFLKELGGRPGDVLNLVLDNQGDSALIWLDKNGKERVAINSQTGKPFASGRGKVTESIAEMITVLLNADNRGPLRDAQMRNVAGAQALLTNPNASGVEVANARARGGLAAHVTRDDASMGMDATVNQASNSGIFNVKGSAAASGGLGGGLSVGDVFKQSTKELERVQKLIGEHSTGLYSAFKASDDRNAANANKWSGELVTKMNDLLKDDKSEQAIQFRKLVQDRIKAQMGGDLPRYMSKDAQLHAFDSVYQEIMRRAAETSIETGQSPDVHSAIRSIKESMNVRRGAMVMQMMEQELPKPGLLGPDVYHNMTKEDRKLLQTFVEQAADKVGADKANTDPQGYATEVIAKAAAKFMAHRNPSPQPDAFKQNLWNPDI